MKTLIALTLLLALAASEELYGNYQGSMVYHYNNGSYWKDANNQFQVYFYEHHYNMTFNNESGLNGTGDSGTVNITVTDFFSPRIHDGNVTANETGDF